MPLKYNKIVNLKITLMDVVKCSNEIFLIFKKPVRTIKKVFPVCEIRTTFEFIIFYGARRQKNQIYIQLLFVKPTFKNYSTNKSTR